MADSLSRKIPAEGAGEDPDAATTAEAEQAKASSDSIDIAEIKSLFILMRENEIAELRIEQSDTKIHIVSKGSPQQQMVPMMGMQSMPMVNMPQQQMAAQVTQNMSNDAPASHGADISDSSSAETGLPANSKVVTSPMVGTFYRSPSPESPLFVKEGDEVTEDSVLCIIEAMKLMNEIKAETRGRIVKVLVENGMPVEFGQPLFAIVP